MPLAQRSGHLTPGWASSRVTHPNARHHQGWLLHLALAAGSAVEIGAGFDTRRIRVTLASVDGSVAIACYNSGARREARAISGETAGFSGVILAPSRFLNRHVSTLCGKRPHGTNCALSDISMNVGMYKGAAGMVAFEAWQETIAQNLASAGVPGYKKSQSTFSAVAADVLKIKHGQSVSQTEQGVMPVTKRTLDTTPGAFSQTGIDSNFAIIGEGYFRVRMPDGTNGYTRNGNFRIAEDYTLVTQEGAVVEGDGGPITFRQQGGRIFINSEGRIMQDEQQIGRLAVFKFDRPEDVHRIGNGILGPVGDNNATAVQNAPVLHMTVEGSNVKLMEEMVNMISLGRAYDSAKKVLDVSDDNAGKAIQYLGAQA